LNAIGLSPIGLNGKGLNAFNLNVCGILGGTFDPVHLGHIALAQAALAELPLGEVLWLPSGSPGHRAPPVANARDRLAMLRLATAGNPRFRIDDGELDGSEPTYTVHTLARLRAQVGNTQPLALLLGSDSFLSLPTWLRWRELFDLAHVAHVNRPGHVPGQGGPAPELSAEIARRSAPGEQLGASAAGRIASFDMPPLDVSSSAIRLMLAAGQDTRHLLPAAVLAYIEAHHLYRKETRKI
jgi:nicotinate-nucleotide adenylyltransferase